MSLIVLPTARIHCACGERLAPHPTAAHRMGLAELLRNVGRCACGAMVLRDPRRAPNFDSFQARCNGCHDAEASTCMENAPGSWSAWCPVCLDLRETAVAERFSAMQGDVK